jgi:hypothetical protein
MRYIKETADHGLCYKSGGKFEVEGYCDAHWAGEKLTRKSTSGYIFCLAGAAISWSSKRQSIIALSSTESEYVGLCFASKEAVWLRRIMRDVGIGCDMGVKPIKIYIQTTRAASKLPSIPAPPSARNTSTYSSISQGR